MSVAVYVLESEQDKKLYIGVSSNITQRLKYHNAGKVQSTKYRRPFRLLGYKMFPSFQEAREIEVRLKRFKDSLRVRNWIVS